MKPRGCASVSSVLLALSVGLGQFLERENYVWRFEFERGQWVIDRAVPGKAITVTLNKRVKWEVFEF